MAELHVADWKRFQDLVGRIQVSTQGIGATIRSPDYLTDLQTGGRREVDASIRKLDAGKLTLITVEARKHKDVQDVTWIEQLSTKRRKVGADLTIAVSGSGFAQEAVLTAAAEGVLVRTLEELEKADLAWLALAFAGVHVKTFRFLDFHIELWEPIKDTESIVLDKELMGDLGIFSYPLLVKQRGGERFSLGYVVRQAKSQGFDPYEGCAVGETSEPKVLRYELYDQGVGITSDTGFKPVKVVLIRYEVAIESQPMPLSSVYRYGAPDKSENIEGVEFDVPTLENAKIVLQKDVADGGRYRGAIIRTPRPRPRPANRNKRR